LEVHLKGNNVNLQIGQEQVILVRNNTGSPLTDGQIVYITGSTGEVPTVALANNKTFTIASRTLGMVTEPIAHGQQGYITITGIVNGLNTNALTEGAAIWLDSLDGAYTESQPASPYNDVLLGYVVKKSGGNGSIFVKAQNILDRNYTDSVVGLRLRIADTVGMRAKEVFSFAKNAARDSAILTLFDGTRLAVRDSIGGGGIGYDTLAIRKVGIHYVGFNSGVGQNGTFGGSRLASTNPAADSSNLFIGRNAGGAITSGWGHIAIGAFALQAKQTGSRDVAIGFEALSANNNASATEPNVAVGNRALRVNTGVRNVAVGSSAAAAHTGDEITAVGFGALTAATGADNVGVGYNAGFSVVGGGRNTYVGSNSGTLSTGSGNVGIGYTALRSVTGNNNVAIGSWNSGSNLETMRGSGNTQSVAIGSSTMTFNNGSQNTYIGANSGRGASGTPHTGAYNNGFGFQTNFNTSAAMTGASNTAIGDRITVPSMTASNQFVYGINAVNYLTRFTDGGWLINYTASAVTTQTASAALEVNGTTGAVLFPRLTSNQITALTGANGMIVYNTTTNKFQGFAAGGWVDLH
jgi:hypothetical protein